MSSPEPKTENAVEQAKLRRHEALLEKVKKQVPLTAGEMVELERFEGSKSLPAGVVRTEREVAAFFAVSTRTVQNWKRDGMPMLPGETYNLEQVAAWREENIQSKKGKRAEDGTDWQQEMLKIKTLRAQLDYDRERGLLVSIEDVNRQRVEKIQTVKKALLALPSRLAPQIVGLPVLESEAVIKARIEEIIRDFAAGGVGIINLPQLPTA